MRLRIPLAFLASSAAGGCVDVAVDVPRTDHIGITTPRPALVVGDTLRVVATPFRRDGNPANRPVGYATSDLRRATVSNAGLTTGVAPGTVLIHAMSDGKRAQVQLADRAGSP